MRKINISIKEAEKALAEHKTRRAAARALGVHPTTLTKALAGVYEKTQNKITQPNPQSPALVALNTSSVTRQLHAERELRKSIQSAFEEYRACNDAIDSLDAQFVAPAVIHPLKTSDVSESISAMFYADWHVFETVRAAEVSGLNQYNRYIARACVGTATRNFCKLTEINRAGTTIKTGMVSFLGDLISGHLWPDQIENNSGSPLEEVLYATTLATGAIDYILKHGGFDRIIVNAVDGNHSRITGKDRRKTNRVKHSLEWLMFQYIKRYYTEKGETRLTFNIGEGIHLYVPLMYGVDARHPNGVTWRLTHGDEGLRYQGGVGGLAIPVNRTIRQWNEARHADLTAFGHWHTSLYLNNALAVGSLLGYSPLSIGYKTQYEAPLQAMLTIEKTRGITTYQPVFVR